MVYYDPFQDEAGRKILSAFSGPQDDWRTPGGIARQAGILVEQVESYIREYSDMFMISNLTVSGSALYALRENWRSRVPLPDKRAILQPILDGIEPGWEIVKPTKTDPVNIDALCIFRKPSENKEARAEIVNSYFQDADQQYKIKTLVETAIKAASRV